MFSPTVFYDNFHGCNEDIFFLSAVKLLAKITERLSIKQNLLREQQQIFFKK